MTRRIERSFREVPGPAVVLSGMLAVVCLCGLWGCGPRTPTGRVSGKVTIGAQPVSEADVLLCRSSDGAAIAKASVGPSGEFAFVQPVPTGSYQVQIESTAQEEAPIAGETKPAPKPKFPTKYQNCRTSGLTAEVKPGDNTFTFELK